MPALPSSDERPGMPNRDATQSRNAKPIAALTVTARMSTKRRASSTAAAPCIAAAGRREIRRETVWIRSELGHADVPRRQREPLPVERRERCDRAAEPVVEEAVLRELLE